MGWDQSDCLLGQFNQKQLKSGEVRVLLEKVNVEMLM